MREALRHLADRRARGSPGRSAISVEVEADALEELAGHRVGVLVRVEDVRAVPVQHLRERCHDAAPVRAAHQQDGRLLRRARARWAGMRAAV